MLHSLRDLKWQNSISSGSKDVQPPLGIVVCHRLRNLWFRKKANYFCGAAPKKMVPIFTAASLLFCFFFLPQRLDCSISHWIILGRTSEEGARQVAERSNNLWLIPLDSVSVEEWRKKKKKIKAISLTFRKTLRERERCRNGSKAWLLCRKTLIHKANSNWHF